MGSGLQANGKGLIIGELEISRKGITGVARKSHVSLCTLPRVEPNSLLLENGLDGVLPF